MEILTPCRPLAVAPGAVNVGCQPTAGPPAGPDRAGSRLLMNSPLAADSDAMMHEPMAEIRFPLRRRSAQTTPATSAPADPLSEMAARIQELDGAAERVAAGIGAAARSLRGPAATGSEERTELLTGLASALVERTDEIRSDCSRLSAMMERTAKLITERDPEPGRPRGGRERARAGAGAGSPLDRGRGRIGAAEHRRRPRRACDRGADG